MFIPMKKELLLKYLFLFAAIFACVAGACSAAFVLITAVMICGVVMTSRAFASARPESARTESLLLDMIFRFVVCGISIISIGIGEGLTQWYAVIIYSVYLLCLSLKLVSYYAEEIKEGERKKRSRKDAQEAAATFVFPLVYIIAAFSRPVFSVVFYIFLCLFAASYLIKLRIKSFPKKLMLVLGIIEGVVLVLILIFTLTGLFTVR